MMKTVLVIVGSKQESDDWKKLLSNERFPYFSFTFPTKLDQDYYSLYLNCCEVIEKEEVSILLSGHDGYQLIHGALCKRYPELIGPSLDSVCAILHRFYLRQTTGISCPNGARMIHVDGNVHTSLATALEDVHGPFMVKDIIRREEGVCKIYKSKRHVWKDFTEIKDSTSVTEMSILSFLKQIANTERFTRLLEPAFIIEEAYSSFKVTSRHIVECCVSEDDFICWVICDKHYWKHYPNCLKGVSLPTKLSEHIKHQIWAIMREVIFRLTPMGFNNYFLRAEVGILGGEPRILDLSCGPYRDLVPLYRMVLINGDTIKAQLDLATDNVVRRPKFLHNKHGYMGVLTTFWTGEVQNSNKHRLTLKNMF